MSSNVDAHNSPFIKTIISEDADYIFDGITGTLPLWWCAYIKLKERYIYMEQREIILRQKLGKHGYKLKGANERFFVKGTYTDKVASQLDDKKQPIYMTLDEVEKWLNDRINEEKQKEQLWKDKLNKYKSILKYPQYAEWCKDVVFDTLNEYKAVINENIDFIKAEVFNSESELYAFVGYNVENILDELQIHKYDMSMSERIRIAFSETYYKKYEELNADVLEKEVDDGEYILQDLVGDGELTENDLLEIAFNDIGVDGLKKYILE